MMDAPGPIVLIPNGCGEKKIYQAASISTGYSKAPKEKPVEVCVTTPNLQRVIEVIPLPNTEVQSLFI